MFAEFNLEGLLRADSKARAEFYGKMTGMGAMTINEVRAKENLPPVEGGEVPRLQMQNVPISAVPGGLDDEPAEPPEKAAPQVIHVETPVHVHLPSKTGEKTIVTKHDSKGRIAEFERRPIEDN